MLIQLLQTWTKAVLRARGARPRTVFAGGYEVRLWEVGKPSGEPWIFLHGLGTTSITWAPVVPSLSNDCRLLLPELSSLGGTTGPHPALDIRDGSRAIVEIIERQVGQPVTLAGFSLGAWIAVRTALDRPDLVQRLILVNAAGFRDQDWDRVNSLVTIDKRSDVPALHKALFNSRSIVATAARHALFPAYTSTSVRYLLGALDERDVYTRDDLGRLTVPVGLIWGDHDGLFPLPVADQMQASMSDAELTVIPRCGHAAHWERPRELTEAVRAFRRSHPIDPEAR